MPAPAPRPGRPPASIEDKARLRERILHGAASAYARLGWHAVTVEDMLAASGVSRPTFYRVFSDKREAVTEVVKRANEDLLALLRQRLAGASQPAEKIEAALDAYFAWGLRDGVLARTIYNEMALRESPVGAERERTLTRIAAMIQQQTRALTQASVEPLLLAGMIHGVEHIGSLLFASPGPRMRERCRAAALRLIHAALR